MWRGGPGGNGGLSGAWATLLAVIGRGMTTRGLCSAIQQGFSERARVIGDAYFREGRVRILERNEGFVEAEVEGKDLYVVRFNLGPGECTCSCDCPAFGSHTLCKHLWAVARAVDAGLAVGRTGSWRRRLQAILPDDDQDSADLWAGVAGQDLDLTFVIDVSATRDADGAHLKLFRRSRLKNGEWGRRNPVQLGPRAPYGWTDISDGLPFSELIERLRSSAQNDVDPYARRLRSGSVFPFAMLPALLPDLCATGRFFCEVEGEIVGDALRFEAGEPWVLGIRVTRGPKRRQCVASGFLARGGERMPIEEPLLLLPSGLLFTRSAVAPFDARGAFDLAVALRAEGGIEAPPADEAVFLDALVRVGARAILELPDRPVVAERPRPHVQVKRGESWETQPRRSFDCTISFDYAGKLVAARDRSPVLLLSDPARMARRDPEAEREALGAFLRLGGTREASRSGIRDGSVAAERFPDLVRGLAAEGWTIEADGRPCRAGGAFRVAVRSGIDWFDLEGGMRFGEEEVSLPALLEAVRSRSGMVSLGDGAVGMLPEAWMAEWGLVAAVAPEEEGRIRFGQSQGFLLDALLAARPEVDIDGRFAELRARLGRLKAPGPLDPGEGFRGELRPYQREGLGWISYLREIGFGGCLADDMGLGKTVQVLAALAARRAAGQDARPCLVVAPKSLTYNWLEEAARFTPELRAVAYTGLDRRAALARIPEQDLVVTTYGTVRRDAADLAEIRFDCVVLDEAQAIKNPQSQAAKAARLLRADHRLVLTGTPIENSIEDLWSLFEFLNPGMLGKSRAFAGAAKGTGAGPAVRERIAGALRPFLLRRTKEQVLTELPGKTEQTLHCEMEGAQRKAYDELRGHYRAALLSRDRPKELGKMKIEVLEALLRLRQAACHPGLLDPARREAPCAKLEVLLPMLRDLAASGHRALVFSQFTSFLAIVRAAVREAGLTHCYLDGATSAKARKEEVGRFDADASIPLFLVSLKAGGVGLNLAAADYVFLLDPWWNPAVEKQAIDRTHRIGQTRPVTAYRLVCRETVEEKVLELQERKRDLADAILGEDASLLRGLTDEDLDLLLS